MHRRIQGYEERLMQAEEANQSKTTFLSRMSHEIRTPMNGIIGMTEIALKPEQSDERRIDCLNKVHASSLYLLDLLNGILDMTKIENNKMLLGDAPFSMSHVVKELNAVSAGRLAARNQKLVVDMRMQHDWFTGDALRLSQVLTNVLGNAVKFTPKGGEIYLEISEIPSPDPASARFVFRISDTGVGMSREYLSHIFEMFTREQNAYSQGVQGTGLGMAITKKLVDQMHGSLDVESEPGKGSTIIAMTANVFADDVKACLDAGMNSHVGKPLDMKVLIGEILKYTDAR